MYEIVYIFCPAFLDKTENYSASTQMLPYITYRSENLVKTITLKFSKRIMLG